jgi:ferritin-like metal-binding protein YciE
MAKIASPRDLLIEELKDLYSAEAQLVKALPKMAKAADSEELRQAFENHLQQTEVHVERLEKIGKQLDESLKGKKCKAMEGLVEEGKDVMEEDAAPALLDLALISAAQKVEHYEIAGYGTARTLAEISGEEQIAQILQETLDEEGETDKLLTEIAMELNLEAAATAEEE